MNCGAAWRAQPIFTWTLPRLSMATMPLADAKSLVQEHSEGHGESALRFPPCFDNVQRKELHALSQRLGLNTKSHGAGHGLTDQP